MEYYISVGNGKRGPYSVEELKARGITSETLVMAEDSATWVPAWQVEELRGIISVKPEPVAEPFGSPSATAQGQPIDSNFENNFNDGERLDNPFRQTSAGAALTISRDGLSLRRSLLQAVRAVGEESASLLRYSSSL